MKRMIARQAEAERERRAKVINAEGELQAADKLQKAAGLLSAQPASLQLRFLQTAAEIAAENNSTTLFPLPLDFAPFLEAMRTTARVAGEARAEGTPEEHSAALEGVDAPGEIEGDRETPGRLASAAAAPVAEPKTQKVPSRSEPDG